MSYDITDGYNREVGVAVLTNATTLTKQTIWEKLESGVLSSMPGTGLNLSGTATINLSASAENTCSANVAAKNLQTASRFLVDAFAGSSTYSNVAWSMGNLNYYSPLYVTAPAIISGLGISVTGLVSGGIIQLGLYYLDQYTMKLIASCSDIDVSTETGVTGLKTSTFSGGNIAVKPGMYYAAFVGNGVAGSVTIEVANGFRHPYIIPRQQYQPSHLYGNARTFPLPASEGPFDGNNANTGPQNHPHIFGVLV